MMIDEIKIIQNTIFEKLNLSISDLSKDLECEEYLGFNFKLNEFNVKFRKAKITPKKIGQFVTLWKRNPETKETEPFNINDDFDFYIIANEFDNKFGFFFFTKKILVQNKILTNNTKVGKRGFRVYPSWDVPENKQAEKTQKWQTEFFIDLSEHNYFEKFKEILNI